MGTPRRTWLNVALLALVTAGLVWLWPSPERAPPPVQAAPDAEPPREPTPEAPLPPSAAPAPPESPRKSLPPLSAGFCAPDGADDSFMLQKTPQKLLSDELERRLAPLSAEARIALDRAAAQLTRMGTLPAEQAETTLLLAFLKGARTGTLLDTAAQVAAWTPSSPYAQVVVAALAEAAGQDDTKIAALKKARLLLPADPALGWSIAQATRDTPDLDEAIAGLSAYLAADPAPAVARLRARLTIQRDLQRDFQRLQRFSITVLWPADQLSSAQAAELVSEVDRALDEAARLTGSRRRKPLTVVVYPGRSELLAVSCVQAWSGGLYDGVLRLVASPEAREGVDHIVLRHESLHAQLTGIAWRAPRWFQEGLAQSFAGEEARVRSQWQLMVRTRQWIPFASLDGTFQIFEANSDANLAYAQSLAMVELVRDCGGDALAEALRAFREGANTPTALARACRRREVTGEELLEFVSGRLSERPTP